ncbi:uncharacterized protein LOC119834458 [Zerene cesonia]|uniref:uncharacterized protein LOC119834229 n=1 Tax=Zerene cesonia TaxID=33412 RepID=UPI0018E53FEA|nr:uncharacterized protein LOC119834229 [Zerene cesonia]XP_038214752.1 uncharacterized protein LOC119834458 [Zerene cesonia]
MCNLPTGLRMWVVFFCYLLAEAKTYPMQGWPVYAQDLRDYHDDDYYYAPKVQYFYDTPAMNPPEVYGQVPYTYMYDPYGHFSNDAPKIEEERFSALPIGQETWFESDSNPRWRSNDMDDVNAAFLDNLILTQMARDAQRRRENARAAFSNMDYDDKDNEDKDVQELKALAGKPLYHAPKSVPRIEDDEDEDYVGDDSDGFINWNGNKRSLTTEAPVLSTESSMIDKVGQKEVVMTRPPQHVRQHFNLKFDQEKRSSPFYTTIARLVDNAKHESSKPRRIDKRFVASDSDLVVELRGLKHRIAT